MDDLQAALEQFSEIASDLGRESSEVEKEGEDRVGDLSKNGK